MTGFQKSHLYMIASFVVALLLMGCSSDDSDTEFDSSIYIGSSKIPTHSLSIQVSFYITKLSNEESSFTDNARTDIRALIFDSNNNLVWLESGDTLSVLIDNIEYKFYGGGYGEEGEDFYLASQIPVIKSTTYTISLSRKDEQYDSAPDSTIALPEFIRVTLPENESTFPFGSDIDLNWSPTSNPTEIDINALYNCIDNENSFHQYTFRETVLNSGFYKLSDNSTQQTLTAENLLYCDVSLYFYHNTSNYIEGSTDERLHPSSFVRLYDELNYPSKFYLGAPAESNL